MNYARSPFLIILFFFALLFLYTKFAGPIPFSVNSIQTTKSNLFSVSGMGEATAIPNTALFSAGITKSAATVMDAQNQANAVINKITSDLRDLGIPEKNIKTTNYNVNPDYDYANGRQTIKGYTVTENLEVKAEPIEKANYAIDIASKNGSNLIGGVQFILDDATQAKLEQDARKQAVEKAKAKAQNLADAAGIKLGRVIDAQEGFASFPRFQTQALDAQKGSVQTPTELSPGENKVSITITLSYETN